MAHNVEYYTYPAKTNTAKINAELQAYASNATWKEGGGGLSSPIRFIDRTLEDYQAAEDFLKQNDNGWYDQLAVKYRQPKAGKTTKKLESLKAKLEEARKERQALNQEVPAKNFKADFVGCRHCKSKLNKAYIETNFCPVCHGDMRADTTLKKLQALSEKIQKLETDIQAEERALTEKYAEIFWLVKIEYHT